MATLEDYSGLEVIADPGPSGAGGSAIQDNFKKLVDWQIVAVKDMQDDAPTSPVEGDRYIVGTPSSGDDWEGHDDEIALYDGTEWDFMSPSTGQPAYVLDEKRLYQWNGSAWQLFGGSPAGTNTEVQFNNSGGFGANSSFTFDSGSTALQVDNLKLDGNTLSTTDTNGNLILSPDGTGTVRIDNLQLDGNTLSITDTNGNLVLSPNGLGAIQVDSGGDPRGYLAIDLQKSRTVATQVASGTFSMARGASCTANDDYATASGNSTTASGNYATASGKSVTASGDHSIAVGINSLASGDHSIACGYTSATASGTGSLAFGYSSTASAYYTIAKGPLCTASASHAVACGVTSTAQGIYSLAFGSATQASGNYSSAFGLYAKASLYGQRTQASGRFAAAADAQASQFILRISTTNATATEMFLDGSAARLLVPTNTAWLFDAQIVAAQQGMANIKVFRRQGAIVNDGGTTSISSLDTIGADQTIGSPGAWSVSIIANDTNDALKIEATGAASTNIRWVARVNVVEVSYA